MDERRLAGERLWWPFPDELTRLLSGRAVGFGIGTALNGVLLRGDSDRNDVADMFRLMTVAMTQMNYRPARWRG
ncbi:hypothetical protein GCM10020258_39250 [Sphingomonas yabuuchiae]